MSRASGAARHDVRLAAVLLVAELGPQPFTSKREAARALEELVPWSLSTVRRALDDPALELELELLVDPLSHPVSHGEPPTEPPGSPIASPQVDGPPAEPPAEVAPYVSTRPLSEPADAGPSQHPRPVHGRRPKEYRRSSFPGRCVVCSEELIAGTAFYLTPYDTGTLTACLEHAPLALAGAQMLYDVSRDRPIPEELELYVRRRPQP